MSKEEYEYTVKVKVNLVGGIKLEFLAGTNYGSTEATLWWSPVKFSDGKIVDVYSISSSKVLEIFEDNLEE